MKVRGGREGTGAGERKANGEKGWGRKRGWRRGKGFDMRAYNWLLAFGQRNFDVRYTELELQNFLTLAPRLLLQKIIFFVPFSLRICQ